MKSSMLLIKCHLKTTENSRLKLKREVRSRWAKFRCSSDRKLYTFDRILIKSLKRENQCITFLPDALCGYTATLYSHEMTPNSQIQIANESNERCSKY